MSLAMDIGASKTVLRSISPDAGSVDVRITYDKATAAEYILDEILANAEHMAACNGRFRRLAIASAPVMDEAGRITSWPNRPDWEGTDLAGLLSPLVLDAILWCDDGVAGTLADASLAPDENLLHLVLGSGVGGSLWLNGQMEFNPDFGHRQIVRDGRLCICGKRGCLQAYLGGRALDAAMQSEVNFDHVSWVDTAADALVLFLKAMRSRHDLSRISFSGGLLKRVPELLAICEKRFTECGETVAKPLQLTVSPFAGNAPLHGAVVLAGVSANEADVSRYGARMVRVNGA